MYASSQSLPQGAILLDICSENLAFMAKLDAAPWLGRVDRNEFNALLTAGQVGVEVCFGPDRDAAVAWIGRHRSDLPIHGVSEFNAARRNRPTLLPPGTGAATVDRLRLGFLRDGRRA